MGLKAVSDLAASGGIVNSVTGTANKITASPTSGAVILTIPDGVVLVGPALGTPASGVLTNATGLPVAGIVNGADSGTWTATFTCGTSGTITLTANTGTYTRIGNNVWFSGLFTVASVSAPVGSLIMGGLPFAAANNFRNYSAFAVLVDGAAATLTTAPVGRVTANTTTATISKLVTGSQTNMAADIQGSTAITVGGWYSVA